MTTVTSPHTEPQIPPRRSIWGRLYHGETSIDFIGRRKWGFIISGIAILITVISLFTQGLNLGLDFKGGVQWEVPAKNLSIDEAKGILDDNGIDPADVKIVVVTASGVDRLRIQTGEQSLEVRQNVIDALSEKAGVTAADVSSNSVTSSWGSEITEKAVRALIVFVILVSLFIAWRFEWAMALSAIAAMFHDVLISVGVYSVFQLEVTPATVIAFLTILGFSLYDTIVVFDKVDENTHRYAGARVPYDDIINVSMNQVLMRSLNTSIAALLPVLSLLVVGAGIMGAIALREFALALFVGLMTGSYSSIFIAAPMLAAIKGRTSKWRTITTPRAKGMDLELLVLGGSPTAARRDSKRRSASTGTDGEQFDARTTVRTPATPDAVLSHPPRPRKKTRR